MATTASHGVTDRDASWASTPKQLMPPSDWLTTVSFGEGLRRSMILLRSHFLWYVRVFFVGGVGMSLLLLPIDQAVTSLAEGILAAPLNPPPDLVALGALVLTDLALMFLENFAIALLLFFLSCIAIHHAFRSVPSLAILRSKTPSRLSSSSVVGAGLSVAFVLAAVGLVVVAVPFMHALLLFTPVCILAGSASGLGAVRLSTQLRRQHWQRLLCALITNYVLTLFAGTLGGTMYLNLQAVLTLLHVSTGPLDPILQTVLTQLPIAMVAPLLPLLSLVFYPSAMTAREDGLRQRFLRRQPPLRLQGAPYRTMPLADAQPTAPSPFQGAPGPVRQREAAEPVRCPQCGAPSKENAQFCHLCGASLG